MIATSKTTAKSSTQVKTVRGDVLTIHRDKTWEQFKHLQQGFENSHGVRLFYFGGTVEILMPGKAHELFKNVIGFLIEAFLFHRETEFEPTGSMTQERIEVASVEADESYEIEGLKLSVEVNFTSGDVGKLKRYQALAVDEVWIWEDGVLRAYHLQADGYKPVSRSSIPALSVIDLDLLSNCIIVGETFRIQAAKTLLAAYPN
ncbi:MAG: Uma2 family endonuclease [Phormidesmis sp.]